MPGMEYRSVLKSHLYDLLEALGSADADVKSALRDAVSRQQARMEPEDVELVKQRIGEKFEAKKGD